MSSSLRQALFALVVGGALVALLLYERTRLHGRLDAHAQDQLPFAVVDGVRPTMWPWHLPMAGLDPRVLAVPERLPPARRAKLLTDEQREEREAVLKARGGTYAGGDRVPAHLGGNIASGNDTASYEPFLWRWMLAADDNDARGLGARSMLDVGCGTGVSSRFFADNGAARVLCVEGSADAIAHSYARDITVEHDYTLGPYVPRDTYDAAWSVEVVEHIEERYIDNYMATMRRARFLFMTHAVWGGYHHVTMRDEWWWIERVQRYGWRFERELTDLARGKCPLLHDAYNGSSKVPGKRNQSYAKFHLLAFANAHWEFEQRRKFVD